MRLFFYLTVFFSFHSFSQTSPAHEEPEELIIIEESSSLPAKKPVQRTYPWADMFRFNGHLDMRSHYQMAPLNERPGRGVAGLFLDAGLVPDSFWEIRLSALGRMWVDFGQQTAILGKALQPGAFVEFYDSYLKLSSEHLDFWAGNLVVPWGVMRAVVLENRLNPIDYRRGPFFPEGFMGRMPQLGVRLRGNWDNNTVEGIFFIHHTPSSCSPVILNEGGFQVGRYQSALSSNEAAWIKDGGGSGLKRGEEGFFLSTFQAALRAKTTFKEADIALQVGWLYDDVPSLEIGKEAWTANWRRALSFGVDFQWPLEVVILKGEVLAQPVVGGKGKTVWLKKGEQIISREVNFVGIAIGLEASYGDVIQLSLEAFDWLWGRVPAGMNLLGVETFGNEKERWVQRAGLGFDVQGNIVSNKWHWLLRGEFGAWPADVSARADVSRVLVEETLKIGLFANVFAGQTGSPGNFRSQTTSFGAYCNVLL